MHKDITKILGSDSYKFVSFGSTSDTSVRIYDKTSILDWLSIPGWTKDSQMLLGLVGASADNIAVTYNFETRIVLACGGQQASIYSNKKVAINIYEK
jgi:hypothetical protein